MPKLIMKFNDAVVKELSLGDGTLKVGRKADNDIVLDEPTVSGHHAQIQKVQAVYFVQDLASTNGTFVNEKRVDRRQLCHHDRVLIGRHVFVYEDETAVAPSHVSAFESDKTIMLGGRAARTADAATGQKGVGVLGTVEVVSGKTDRVKYVLTARLTIIGAQERAGVRLTRWFAPKTAALITRLPDRYYISRSDSGHAVTVNGVEIGAKADLKDGDLIEVAGVRMYFFQKAEG